MFGLYLVVASAFGHGVYMIVLLHVILILSSALFISVV